MITFLKISKTVNLKALIAMHHSSLSFFVGSTQIFTTNKETVVTVHQGQVRLAFPFLRPALAVITLTVVSSFHFTSVALLEANISVDPFHDQQAPNSVKNIAKVLNQKVGRQPKSSSIFFLFFFRWAGSKSFMVVFTQNSSIKLVENMCTQYSISQSNKHIFK